MSNVKVIAAELKRIGLSGKAIAGILGNLQQESGYRPEADNGTHRGIAQWDSIRWGRFQRKAREKGWGDTGSIEAQAKYLAWEITSGTGGTSVKRLNSASSIRQAVDIFEADFERSGRDAMENRYRFAQQYKGGKTISGAGKGDKGGGGRTYTWVPGMTDKGYNPFHSRRGIGYSNPQGWHTGEDISASAGAKIIWAPPVDGTVIKSGWGGDYGNYMIIRDENGREWLFAHMNKPGPKVGKTFTQGDQIGEVGNSGTNTSGPHLHIEQTVPGKGTWTYNSDLLKNPKLSFRSKSDYQGGTPSTNSGRTQKGFFGNIGNFSASYLDAPGNEALRKIYAKAKKEDWSEQRVQNAIYESDWYKTRSQSQRTFDKMTGADQQATLREKIALVKRVSLEMGVPLTKEQTRFEAMRLSRDGDSDEQLKFWLAGRYEYDPEGSTQGFVRTFQEDLEDMARAYGYTVGDNEKQLWTREAIQAGLGADSYEDEMRANAQRRFPELKLEGRTLADALAPWMDTAARELGIDSSEIDLRDPKWTDLVNPETGTMYTNDEYRKVIRTDSRFGWRDRQNGKREFSQAAGIVGRLFGASNYGG